MCHLCMQSYISTYIRSTKFTRKLIEWVTSADQTQQTVKDRVVYYRYEGEENTGIQDEIYHIAMYSAETY